MKDNKELYYYDDSRGIYLKGGEWLIEQKCVTYFPQVKTKDVTDTKNRIIWANYVDRSDFDSQIEWLCCKNVMVNLVTGGVKPHSPEFMATVQIPRDYIISKGPLQSYPTKIWKFFHQVMAKIIVLLFLFVPLFLFPIVCTLVHKKIKLKCKKHGTVGTVGTKLIPQLPQSSKPPKKGKISLDHSNNQAQVLL